MQSGTASISTVGTTTTINQTTDRVSINWTSLDTAATETLTFTQPGSTSIAFNRVLSSGAPTTLQGALNANGRVWIMNPNGVAFNNTSVVDVGGLLATTGNISDTDFQNGIFSFSPIVGAPAGAQVVLDGTATAAGSGIVLVAPTVLANGTLTTTDGGQVILGAGEAFNLDISGTGLLTVQITDLGEALTVNGSVNADGSVTLDASVIVNTGGAINATTMRQVGSDVFLIGDSDVTINGSITSQGDVTVRAADTVNSHAGSTITAASGSTIFQAINDLQIGQTTATSINAISGSGAVTQSGTVTGTTGDFDATGNITLTDTGNALGTVTADSTGGAVAYTDSDAVTITGSADQSFAAITETGDLTIGAATTSRSLIAEARTGSIDLTQNALRQHDGGIMLTASNGSILLAANTQAIALDGDVRMTGTVVAPSNLTITGDTVSIAGSAAVDDTLAVNATDANFDGDIFAGDEIIITQRDDADIGFGTRTGTMSLSQSDIDSLRSASARFRTGGDMNIGTLAVDGGRLNNFTLRNSGTVSISGDFTGVGTTRPNLTIGDARMLTNGVRPISVTVSSTGRLGSATGRFGDVAFNVAGDVTIGNRFGTARSGETIFGAEDVLIDIDGGLFQENTGSTPNTGTGALLNVVTIENAQVVDLFGSVISGTTGARVDGTNSSLGVINNTTPSNDFQVNGCVVGELGSCTPFGDVLSDVEIDDDLLERILIDDSGNDAEAIADRGNEEWWRATPVLDHEDDEDDEGGKDDDE